VNVGIGLPKTLSVGGAEKAEWARRAHKRGVAALAMIDRIVCPAFDSPTSVVAAAAGTTRNGLLTHVLLARSGRQGSDLPPINDIRSGKRRARAPMSRTTHQRELNVGGLTPPGPAPR
jgi:hypothetical protein